jgi:proteasome accessory factor B
MPTATQLRDPPRMRRIERLINLIAALLDSPRPMTAEEIRESIAGYQGTSQTAFRRNFERDKETLRAMGIPLEVRQLDPFGVDPDGYTIPKERYYLPELDLEPDELAALRIAADAILGSNEIAEAGLMKLAAESDGLPAAGPRIAWAADLVAEQPVLAAAYTAVADRKTIRFSYQRAGEDTSRERTVEPYSLVHRKGHWYVIGRDVGRDAVRAFKVSRVAGPLTMTGENYRVPETFDAAAHLGGEAWEVGPDDPETATVRFSPNMRWWAEQNLGDVARRDVSGGGLDVDLPVANLDALVSWVIGFAGEVQIITPESARTHMRTHLRKWAGKKP